MNRYNCAYTKEIINIIDEIMEGWLIMKYFLVEGSFKNPLTVKDAQLEEAINEHLTFLEEGFNEGWILVSGPKVNIGGGIIIIKRMSLREVENYLAKDPLKILGVQEYRIVEFKLHECQDLLKKWFE